MSEKRPPTFEEDWKRHYRDRPIGPKAHWCPEWDYLPIDSTVPEFDACVCDFSDQSEE